MVSLYLFSKSLQKQKGKLFSGAQSESNAEVPEENTARAVLACVPEERQPVLGLTAETAAAFLCHFGVTASSIASDVYLPKLDLTPS